MINNVILGDCQIIIPTSGQYDFIFADPPFNINQNYIGFKDDIDDYEEFTHNWISLCWNACNGILALHGNDTLVELYLNSAKLLKMNRIAWINLYYDFGQCTRNNFIDSRCHCLIFSKNLSYTWNPDSVLIDSARVQYNDKRIFDSVNGGKRLPGTVWGIPEKDGKYWGRVQGNNKERREGHPNQLPEVYLTRLILAYTNEGDSILDPFGGSGTTIVVANSLKRNCTTIDISEYNVTSIKERISIGSIRNIIKQKEAPPMHYLIIQWDVDNLKWNIIHYSHSIDDMDQKMKEYPEPKFVHLIDLKWLKSHEIMQQVQAFKEKMKAQI